MTTMMVLTDKLKKKIQSILNVDETGTLEGEYSNISVYADGPGNIRQITYGKSQTTEYGLLHELIKMYVEASDGLHAKELEPYLDKIGKVPLVRDSRFAELLRVSGLDPVMKTVQDKFFDEFYWNPAVKWADDHGFTLPLSMLVIYDSFIQSGGVLMFLRNRFKESVPSNGGDEKTWIKEYVSVRHAWLKYHKSRPILHKTVYRTEDMMQAIDEDDWLLEKPYDANNVIVLKHKKK